MNEIQINCPVCNSEKSKKNITSPVQLQQSPLSFDFHSCTNCEAVYLKNPPNAQELSYFYSENYLPHLGSSSWGKYKKFVDFGQSQIDNKRVKLVQKFCPKINSNTRILDYGCGHPTFLKSLEQKIDIQCVGYDLFSTGWKNNINNFSNIKLIDTNADELKTVKKFDVVTLWHTFEHEFEPQKILAFLTNITTQKGKLIIEVPNYNSITRKLQNKYWGGYHTPRHSIIYSPQTLEYILKNSGWEIEKKLKYGTIDAFTLWWLGYFDKKRNKNKQKVNSLEKFFWNFMLLKMFLFPIFCMEKFFNFGIMTVICKKSSA